MEILYGECFPRVNPPREYPLENTPREYPRREHLL